MKHEKESRSIDIKPERFRISRRADEWVDNPDGPMAQPVGHDDNLHAKESDSDHFDEKPPVPIATSRGTMRKSPPSAPPPKATSSTPSASSS